MKRMIVLFLMAAFSVPSLTFAGIISPARIQLVNGDVMFHTPESGEWLPVSVNTPLDEGDAIWTPAGSRTEVQFTDGTVVRLDGLSQLDIIAIEEGFTHLHLANGRLYLKTSPNTGINALQIDADDTTVLPEARTRLRIDMLPNSQEDISIFKGTAYVEGNGNRTKVRAGEQILLEEGHSELLALNPPDDWEKWNIDRDRSQSRSIKAESYLPDELQPFSGELESNGRWEYVPEYGRVWRPTAFLADDWAPYQNGRWIWKENDYVWVSNENWGWVPYHYGRWAVVSGFGWCWVPPVRGDIYWGPGYVGWYRTGSHVGWTPLAPGETFYGHKSYGHNSVNISNTHVSTATVEYRNRDARGGFSILLQNDFLKGRTAFQRPSNSAAFSASVSLGSPRIQPLRETRMPSIRQTPPKATPPAIQHHDNQDLRTRFPRLTPDTVKQTRPQPIVIPSAPAVPTSVIRSGTPSIPRQNGDGRFGSPQPQSTINLPSRKEQPSLSNQAEKHASPGGSSRKGELPVQVNKQKEQKQKKVWKVISTEKGSEKNQRDNDNKEHKRDK